MLCLSMEVVLKGWFLAVDNTLIHISALNKFDAINTLD